MVIASVTVMGLEEGTSLGKHVAVAIEVLKAQDVKYNVSPMETSFEVPSVDEAFRIVSLMHNAVAKAGAKRILTTVKIDDRRDKKEDMAYKVARAKGEI